MDRYMTPVKAKKKLDLGVRAVACLLTVVGMGLGAAPSRADEYRLGPQDKLRLKVYEWRASRDEIFEVEAFSDTFTVGPTGKLALPIVGEIDSAGLTTGEVADRISIAIKTRMGLVEAPTTAAEVVQFRPVYVTGQVDRPGEYPFRPGLTVLQAVSVSGGLIKINDAGLQRLSRESISGRGDLVTLMVDRQNQIAKKARLEAELNSATSVTFPAELTSSTRPTAATAMQQESYILQARRESLDSQVDALNKLKIFLEKEIQSLTAQLQTADTQIALINKELAGVSSLVEKGLAVSPRQLQLERTVAQLQGDRLRQETEILRARQEVSRADISISDLRSKVKNEVALELRVTQAKLDEINQKIETAKRLVFESEVTAPALMMERQKAQKVEPSYSILRVKDGNTTEIAAHEWDRLEPGDTLKVKLPIADINETPTVSSEVTGG